MNKEIKMSKISLALIAGILLFTTVPVNADEVNPQKIAAGAVGQLGQELRKKLLESMQKYGPEGAIDVCAKDAPRISSRIGQERGVVIKRTSLKVRNPRNAPDQAERELLESLDSIRKAGGTLPTGVTAFPHAQNRFYKTIMVEQPCLKCHGTPATMSDVVRRKIADTYPDDRAIGYKEGDFRGIISVTVK
jgi:hypothetical protein